MSAIILSQSNLTWPILIAIFVIIWVATFVDIIRSNRFTYYGKFFFILMTFILPVVGTILYLNLRDKNIVYRLDD